MGNKPAVLLLKSGVLVCHMLNSFDYFDYKLEMFVGCFVADFRSEWLCSGCCRLQTDCILRECSIVEAHGLHFEQLDPNVG